MHVFVGGCSCDLGREGVRRKDQAPAVRNNQGWRVTAEIRAEMNAGAIETGEAPLAATLGPVLPGAPALHASSGERPLNAMCGWQGPRPRPRGQGQGSRPVCARVRSLCRGRGSRALAPPPRGLQGETRADFALPGPRSRARRRHVHAGAGPSSTGCGAARRVPPSRLASARSRANLR